MRLVNGSIPQIMNGVSQQSASLRLPSQGEEQINGFSSVVDGLYKRPSSEHVAKVSETSFGSAYTHIINRDETEQYVVVVTNGDLQVFDFDGNEMTVLFPDGKDYLTNTSPQQGFATLTITDYTFIANRSITVELLDAPDDETLTGSYETFADLPASPTDGEYYKINNTSATSDSYFVLVEDERYYESRAPNTAYQFDASTMPHELVRTGVDEFTFRQVVWDEKMAGDEDTNPAPSFVGKTISDIFLFRSRMGFIADESIILSEAGSEHYYNFWKTTVRTSLDSDRIDTPASHTKLAILKHAIPYNDFLLVFSAQTPFRLTSDGPLTNSTAKLSPLSELESSLKARPVGVGSYIYFPVERGNYTSIIELFVDQDTDNIDDSETSKHVPRYIPKDVIKIAESSNENMLVLLSEDSPANLYVNQFYYGPAQEGGLQNSWHRWEFAEGDTILDIEFIKSYLYILVERSDGVYLERMGVESGRKDDGLDFLTRLDRKATLTGVYDSDSHTTTWTLPYGETESLSVIKGGDWEIGAGLKVLNTEQPTSDTITVTGNYSAHPCIIGRNYTFEYRFSEQFVREDRGRVAVTSAHLQLRRFLIRYALSGYFKAVVSSTSRDDVEVPFTGRVIGSSNNTIGRVALETGDFIFPVDARSDQTVVKVVSDSYLPLSLLSAEWEAGVHLRAKRI